MRPELVFFIAFNLLFTQNWHFLAKKSNLKNYFYRNYLNLKKNHTKGEQISCVHTKSQSSITPRKKNENQKNLFNFEFYAGPDF